MIKVLTSLKTVAGVKTDGSSRDDRIVHKESKNYTHEDLKEIHKDKKTMNIQLMVLMVICLKASLTVTLQKKFGHHSNTL